MRKTPESFGLVLLAAVGALAYVFHLLYEETVKAAILRLLSRVFDAPEAELMSRLAEMSLPLLSAFAISFFIYWYLKRYYFEADGEGMQIRFGTSEPYVLPVHGLHGVRAERYFVEIYNGHQKTITEVTLRALDSWFTREVIVTANERPSYRVTHIHFTLLTISSLHPNTSEVVEMFGLGYGSASTNPKYILNTKQRFVLEATARDVEAVRAEFEFDRSRRPMVRQVS